MKQKSRVLSLLLAAAFLLSGNVLAASDVKERREDLEVLYDTLTEQHPDAFFYHTEKALLAKKQEIEGTMESVDDITFGLQLQSLVAMLKDGHTSANYNNIFGDEMRYYPFQLGEYNGDWILTMTDEAHKAYLGLSVERLGGVELPEVLHRMEVLVSTDNDTDTKKQFKQMGYVAQVLSFLEVAEEGKPLTVEGRDETGSQVSFELPNLSIDEEIELVSISSLRDAAPASDQDRTVYYKALPLDEGTLYIQYNRCQENPDLPMEDFTAQVAAVLEKGAYTKVLIDLRYNSGGSDGVLYPMMNLLSEEARRGTKVYCLIGEGTYSSAIINAVMLREAGALLAGGPTSGNVNHFGQVSGFFLPNSGIWVSHSTKFISLAELFEAAQRFDMEPLVPDVPVEQTLEDYLSGVDTLVSYLTEHGDGISAPSKEEQALTRGGFVDMIWQTVDSGDGPEDMLYEDVYPFAYYYPAIQWATEHGVAKGAEALRFLPARQLTYEELAVFLYRLAQAMDLNLDTLVPEGAVPQAFGAADWACEAVEFLFARGVYTAEDSFGAKDNMTVSEGARLLTAFFLDDQ